MERCSYMITKAKVSCKQLIWMTTQNKDKITHPQFWSSVMVHHVQQGEGFSYHINTDHFGKAQAESTD